MHENGLWLERRSFKEISNDAKGIKNSDYDKSEGTERSGGRMGTNSKNNKDRRTGRTNTGLFGQGTDGNAYESGSNKNIRNETGLRGDRVLKQNRRISPKTYDEASGESDATVTAWLQTSGESSEMDERMIPAIVICPGGAYKFLSDREAEPVAKEYYKAGYHIFILRYSVGKTATDFKPLSQLAYTVAYIRAQAENWKVDKNKIAVCGFSAGGHLAASLGTMFNKRIFLNQWEKTWEIRPNAMVLGYPVISSDEYVQADSIENVSGAKMGTEAFLKFGLEQYVDAETPPAFIWHTAEDNVVMVENSLHFAEALSAANVSFELHILPKGGHGMSVCTKEVGTEDAYNGRWVEWSIQWLNNQFSFSA